MESQIRAEITFMALILIVVVRRAKSVGMNQWRTDMFEWSIVDVDAAYLQKLQDDLAEYQRIGSVEEFMQLKSETNIVHCIDCIHRYDLFCPMAHEIEFDDDGYLEYDIYENTEDDWFCCFGEKCDD